LKKERKGRGIFGTSQWFSLKKPRLGGKKKDDLSKCGKGRFAEREICEGEGGKGGPGRQDENIWKKEKREKKFFAGKGRSQSRRKTGKTGKKERRIKKFPYVAKENAKRKGMLNP